MFSFAVASDVEAVWGTALTEAQERSVEVRIEQASAEIRNADPLVGGLTIDERITASEAFGIVVKGVVVDMVRRLLVNPDGRLEVHADDAGYRLDSAVSTGSLYLSPAEYRKLFGAASGGQVFTVGLGTPNFGCAPSWASTWH